MAFITVNKIIMIMTITMVMLLLLLLLLLLLMMMMMMMIISKVLSLKDPQFLFDFVDLLFLCYH